MRDQLLYLCDHSILQTTCENLIEFAALMHLGIKMNWLDFDIRK